MEGEGSEDYDCPECGKTLCHDENTAVAILKGEAAIAKTGHGSTRLMTVQDYIHCGTCDMDIDFWKYRRETATEEEALKNCGHFGHNWRYVTPDELPGCVSDCESQVAYCPVCDHILNLPAETCDSCGWVVIPATVVYRNCFDEGE